MKFDLKDFGCNVFSEKEMAKSLPGPVFDKWHEAYNKEDVLDANTASAIAHAMKEWAISKGCTHFTLFQELVLKSMKLFLITKVECLSLNSQVKP